MSVKPASGEVYKKQLAYAGERETEWNEAKIQVKMSDRVYNKTRQGHHTAYIFSPVDSILKTMSMFSAVIPVGKHSGLHRHNCEAIVFIERGRGYTIIDTKRYNWEKGDAIAVPPMVWHQHFNTDPHEEAEYIAITNIPLMMGIGAFKLEQKEDAGSGAM